MEYDEKNIEEFLNTDEVRAQIELSSNSLTILELLVRKDIIKKEEFEETKKEIIEKIKEGTKEIIKQRLEEVK